MPENPPPPYLVKIECRISGTKDKSQGSGVYITPNLILTARHVLRPKGSANWATKIQVNGTAAKVYEPARQTAITDIDLAVLIVTPGISPDQIPPWRKSRQFNVRDKVTAQGYPGGIFDQREFEIHGDGAKHIQVSPKFDEGASGGVLLHGEDATFWCCAVIAEHIEAFGNAIPYEKVAAYLNQLDLELPTQPMPRPAAHIVDVERYRREIRDSFRLINLGGLAINGQEQQVEIDRLWVPAVTQHQGQGEIPLLEAVNANRVLVVEAEAGSGKTTFLQRIGYAMLRQEDPKETLRVACRGLPLWVRLRSLEEYIAANRKNGAPYPADASDHRWISHYLAAKEEAKNSGLNIDYFAHRLKEPQPESLLLLDGLDEVSATAGPDMRALITSAISKYKCRIVISTRPEVYLQAGTQKGALFAGAIRNPILPMNDEAVRAFITLWTRFAAKSKEEKDSQEKRLHSAIAKPAIRRYARNPLMLTAMAVLTTNGQTLPEERAKFFNEIVTWMIEARKPKEKGTVRRRLRELAWKMIESGSKNQYQISIKEAARLIQANFKADPGQTQEEAAKEFLEEAQRTTGLLTLRGSELSFWHRYLQEFLAADRLSGWSAGRAEWVPKLVERRNSGEVVKLLVGLIADHPEDLTQTLLPVIDTALASPLEAQAYVVGLIGSAFEDLKASDYFNTSDYREEIGDKWCQLKHSVDKIFQDTEEAAAIPIQVRANAADAVGQAGDTRLRLPDQPDYWVQFAGGEFWMGAQSQDSTRKDYDSEVYPYEDHRKENPESVKPFAIGKYPVTVHEFDVYRQDLGVTLHEGMRFEEQLPFPNRPVVRITVAEAEGYRLWASTRTGATVRLPQETEWEFAARGPGQPRRYPWGGDTPGENHANFAMAIGHPSPVGLFPKGATPPIVTDDDNTIIYDLAGNVWEWTASIYQGQNGRRMLRGGSYAYVARYLRSAFRNLGGANFRDYDIGFRCVREGFP